MKILYLVTRADRGGAQVHIVDLIRGFRDRCEIEVAAGEEGYLFDEARRLRARCHAIPHLGHSMRPLHDLQALKETIALLCRVRPDVVHAHTSKAGVVGRMAAWICGIPAVFTAHTWCFAEGTSWKWKLGGGPFERIAGMAGGPIINVSHANRELALRCRVAPPERLEVIHNGIPWEPLPPALPPDRPDEPIVIMVARFVPQKNQAMLLEAAARVRVRYRIQFVGDGPTLPQVQKRAARLGLLGRVEFLGERADVPELLRRASVFALPTHWEGLPISILEAMRAGLPIVASNVGGVSEALIDGQNGFLTRRKDTAAFARSLEVLLGNEAQRRRMGDAGRSLFERQFTSERMIAKTWSVYERALECPAGEYAAAVSGASENA
jgi:glycosyltransferase involved in cell wall biosynthesis